MLGFHVTVKNEEGTVLAKINEGMNDGTRIFRSLRDMEKDGKSKCIVDNCGYPYKYTVKACDIMPLIAKWFDQLSEIDPRSKGKCWIPGYGVTPDLIVETTKNKSELPAYSPDETLVVELWDLS